MSGAPALAAAELARLVALARPCICGATPLLTDRRAGEHHWPSVSCRDGHQIAIVEETLAAAVEKWNALAGLMPSGAGRLTPVLVAQAMAVFGMIGDQLEAPASVNQFVPHAGARAFERACRTWLLREAAGGRDHASDAPRSPPA